MCSEKIIPVCGKDEYIVPNIIARSSTFSVSKSRPFMNDVQIYCIGDTEISLNGYRPNIDDIKIWLAVYHFWARAECPDVFEVSPGQILNKIELGSATSNRRTLANTLARLIKSSISVTTYHHSPNGKVRTPVHVEGVLLLNGARFNHKTRKWSVAIDPRFIDSPFFGVNEYTRLESTLMNQLGKNQTAIKFLLLYASHRHAYAMKLDTLLMIADCSAKNKGAAKSDLKVAINELGKVANMQVVIEKDLVKVNKIGVDHQSNEQLEMAWQAYAKAIVKKYKEMPLDYPAARKLIKSIVSDIGIKDPIEFEDFFGAYVGSNVADALKCNHDLAYLKKNISKFHMEWKTGERITQTRAYQADRIQTFKDERG
jgi:hypothetical protein